jgi:hypothetical protein
VNADELPRAFGFVRSPALRAEGSPPGLGD